MNKFLKSAVSLCLGAAMVLPLAAGCDTGKSGGGYELSFVPVDGKYAVRVEKGDDAWENAATGAFGVRVSYDSINNVSDVQYAYYDSYRQIDGGWIASASLTSEDGSTFTAEDTFRLSEDGVEIVRDFSVTGAGTAEGFMTYFPMRDTNTGDVMSREWFSPGSYYGNEEYSFWGTGIKFGFTEEAVAPADNMSAPVIANYNGGTAFSITDRTGGYRETVINDTNAAVSSIIVDEAFNIPGIGLKDVSTDGGNYVEMYHCYPANTHNYINIYPFTNNYRMLPIEEGLSRQVAFEIKIDDYDTFDDCVNNVWDEVYDEYSVIERRYAPKAAYEALTQYLYNSYGILNGVPQYMTNSDHPYTESGFLYRNTDLAYLMIAAGYRLNKPEYITQADTLIDYHIEKDLIVDNIVNESERAESEGVMAVFNAYKTHLDNGVDKSDWLAYILRKAREKKEDPDPMAIPLFLMVAEYTNDSSYIDVSAELLKDLEEQHNDWYFTGAIVNNSGDPIPNREAGMIYMNIYLSMYELTGEESYLDLAKKAETYVETNMILQNIAMTPEGTTGYETLENGRFREIGTLGNEQVKPYGLSWVSGQTASADNASAYAVPDILRLYDLTGDSRYLEFADYIMTNSLLYINMGDKSWLMDDIRHNSGLGFQNEYFGIAASTDVVSAGRGTMHMSNLGWNMFVVLYSLNYWADRDENFLVDTVETYDTAVLKNASATSSLNSIYRPYNAVDKNSETMWKPAADDEQKSITVDLGEYVNIDIVRVNGRDLGGAVLSVSTDGVNFTQVSDDFSSAARVSGVYRYVRVSLASCGANAAISDLKVMGNPVVGHDYAKESEITVSGVMYSEMSDWSYRTRWASSRATDTILVDMGKIRAITEVSMLFNINIDFNGQDYISAVHPVNYSYLIEYSPTGDDDDWHVYADRTAEPRMLAVYVETNFARARYLRITATASTGVISMTELKIFGV